jgi:hypothetical protein
MTETVFKEKEEEASLLKSLMDRVFTSILALSSNSNV